MQNKLRRMPIALPLLGIPAVIVAILVGTLIILPGSKPVATASVVAPSPSSTYVKPKVHEYVHKVLNIPVLAYHQFDHLCTPDAAVCNAADNDETLSQRQFSLELSYLKRTGYETITAAEYGEWVAGDSVPLPAKPLLITDDDGTLNSYVDVTSILETYGYNAVMFVVTEFADGATARGKAYIGWDATWANLLALPADVWSFGFHAGAHGHDIAYPKNLKCTYFYPCQLPGEPDQTYESRVITEVTQGRAEEKEKLGSRLDPSMWAVPWNDLSQEPALPVSGSDPKKWLPGWADSQFPIIFTQTPSYNGDLHEHYRLEIQGTWSEAFFEIQFNNNINNGFFDRG